MSANLEFRKAVKRIHRMRDMGTGINVHMALIDAFIKVFQHWPRTMMPK